MSTQVASQKRGVISFDIFRDAVVAGVRGGFSQSKAAKLWAEAHNQSEATFKQRYNDMVKKYEAAIAAENVEMEAATDPVIKENHIQSALRLNKALGALRFTDGRLKGNREPGTGGRKGSDVVLDMTAYLEEQGFLTEEATPPTNEEGAETNILENEGGKTAE